MPSTAITPDRHQVLRRVVDHYLHTAYAAGRLLDQQHPAIDLGESAAGSLPGSPLDDAAAMSSLRRRPEALTCAVVGQASLRG